MARNVQEISRNAALLLLVYLVAVQPVQVSTTGTTSSNRTLWSPNTAYSDPVSPVNYLFGADLICPVLTPSSSAVIVQHGVINSSQVFMVDLPQDVPIGLVQRTGQCEGCPSLIIMSQSSNLTEGEFLVFYDGRESRIKYGPLGLFNPVGGNVLPFNPDGIYTIYYRTLTQEQFIVCRNGSIANFQVSVSPLDECASGSNGGGFSTPFELTIVYGGSESIIEQNFTITSSQSCEDPNSGDAFAFTISEAVPVTTPTSASRVTPTHSVSTLPPTASNSTTDTSLPPSSSNTVTIVIGVVIPIVTIFAVMGIIIIIRVIINTRTRKKYKVKRKCGNGTDHVTKDFYRDCEENEPDAPVTKHDGTSPAQPSSLPIPRRERQPESEDRAESHDDQNYLGSPSGSSKGKRRSDGEGSNTQPIMRKMEELKEQMNSIEQSSNSKLDAMKQETNALKQETHRRFDGVDSKLDDISGKVTAMSSEGSKTTNQKLDDVRDAVNEMCLNDSHAQDHGEDLTETGQEVQQPIHVQEMNNNLEVWHLSHELKANAQQKELKDSTQLEGNITVSSSQPHSNGNVVTNLHKDDHKSEK